MSDWIKTEFDRFFEFPTDDKTQVTSFSCRLFVEHMLAKEREACAKIAETAGCGKPGCTDCIGGAVADVIRSRGETP